MDHTDDDTTDMLTPGADDLYATLRAKTHTLLIERLRVVVLAASIAVPVFAVAELWFAPAGGRGLPLIKFLQIALAVVVLGLLRGPAREQRALPLSLLVATTFCVTTAASNVLRGDITLTPMLLSILTIGCATVLPWGLGPQLVVVTIATLSILWNVYAVTGGLGALLDHASVAVVIAFVGSLYLAYALERHRWALEVRNLALRESERFAFAALDSLSAHIAILDTAGTIVAVNTAWRTFADSNGAGQAAAVERANYLAVCDAADGDGAAEAHAVANGIRAVIGGAPPFSLEYACHAPFAQRWYIVRVTRFQGDGPTRVVIAHEDITERKRAENALLASERGYRELFENANDIVYTHDLAGTFTSFNKAAERLLGYTHDEARDLNIGSIVAPEDLDRAAQTTLRQLMGETPPPYTLDVIAKDGQRITVEVHTRLVLENGTPAGVQGIARNVTERRRMEDALRRSEEHFRNLIEHALDVVTVVDRDGTIRYQSPSIERVTGYRQEELIGHNLFEFLHTDDIPEALAGFARRINNQGDSELLQIRIRHRDGSWRTLESLASNLLEDETIAAVVVNSRDITERKRAEVELQQAKDTAEAANRAKSEFVANMSHEIRTPMNGIIGMTELALATELTAEQREYLEMVVASGRSLTSVINDILDFSKIEAGKLELDPIEFALRESLHATITLLAVHARQNDLPLRWHVAADVPDVLIGDVSRLRQVLINLVGNAIKFTHRGEVEVTVDLMDCEFPLADLHDAAQLPPTADPQSDIALHFAVRDTGIGIASGKQRRIFEAFAQADNSTTRQYGGTGLGLTISHRLVEMMGGRMWVESAANVGSTFHFTVRMRRALLCSESVVPAEFEYLHGLPILVLDGDPPNRRILEATLTGWRMRPTSVDNAAAALALLESATASGHPFALALLDQQLPDAGGWAVVEHIEQRPALAGLTIMMLGGDQNAATASRCRERGFACLPKPVQPGFLLDTLRVTLGVRPPRIEVCAESTPAIESAHHGTRPLHVLLAEDNAVNQRLAARLLEKRGHSVVVVGNGNAALIALEAERFDLVLMDIQMPEMDGLEAAAEIRQRERESQLSAESYSSGTGRPSLLTGHVPIIAMTAHAMKGDEQRCLAAGMDAYVAKPINPQELFNTIDATLTRSAATPSNQEAAAISDWAGSAPPSCL